MTRELLAIFKADLEFNPDGERVSLQVLVAIDETPLDNENPDQRAGYLIPIRNDDQEFQFAGNPEDDPEEWRESRGDIERLRNDRKDYALERVAIDSSGVVGKPGIQAWFIPGKFPFCPVCKNQPAAQAREINKLAGLSAEGRSSATTVLASSALFSGCSHEVNVISFSRSRRFDGPESGTAETHESLFSAAGSFVRKCHMDVEGPV